MHFFLFIQTIIILLILSGCITQKTNSNYSRQSKSAVQIITVRNGDTLYSLSRRYDVTLRNLINQNHLIPPFQIFVGQKLRFKLPQIHRVQAGETIFSLSNKYDLDMRTLVSFNSLKAPFQIRPGDTIKIPNQKRALKPLSAKKTSLISRFDNKLPFPKSKPKIKNLKNAFNKTKIKGVVKSKFRLATPAQRSSTRFLWPVRGRIISNFGPRLGGLHNDGINIAAPKGSPVFAAENGVVAYAGNSLKGFGNLILVKHSGGWVTAYAHTDKMLVVRGKQVMRGEKIATIGATGGVKKPQLHFEIRKGSQAVDPKRELTS
jgi:murein DD-endopeptidase MepM/ murein hydrolase activator NlpD